MIPNDQNVTIKNPARGFVSSANQYPVDGTYPYYINATHYEGYRNRRINDVLKTSPSITIQHVMNLQNDTYNLKAAESLPTFLSFVDSLHLSEPEKKAFKILRAWDYYNTVDSEGASYYEAWWDALMPLIWDELKRPDVTLSYPTTFNTIKLIKEKPDLDFFDIKTTPEKETAREVVNTAFKLGVKAIEKWKKKHSPVAQPSSTALPPGTVSWADYKDSYIGHLLRIEPLNIHVRHGGNHDIVNAHSKTHGPSWRMIVSLEKTGIKTWATYPGGQSGNPGSKHYSDMLDRWVKGHYYPMLFLQTAQEPSPRIFYSTQLNPVTE
jgi:penicillin amidase